MTAPDTIASLREGRAPESRGAGLATADLRAGRLAGVRISHAELAGADLRGADLAGAWLEHVDLSAADLRGARLVGARLRLVSAGSARLDGCDLTDATLDGCDLRACSLTDALLARAWLGDCVLEVARLERADLSGAALHRCVLDGAKLAGAALERSTSRGSSWRGAELDAARRFASNRDAVAEVLRAAAGDDVELAGAAGAVRALEGWCWDAWARYWQDAPPRLRAWAVETFARYPHSGCAEAMRSARDVERKPARSASGRRTPRRP